MCVPSQPHSTKATVVMKRDQDTAVNSVCFKQNRRWKGHAATFTYNLQCLALGKEEFGPAYLVAALCVRAQTAQKSVHQSYPCHQLCIVGEDHSQENRKKKSLTLLSAPELPLDLGSDRGFQDVLKDQHLQPG
ncbi:hypothetical protein NDU88_004757 [Pleurodeles waltl]|uniref:Uncharacterized protein n=1 Tax=Pleurodeles waltl TaxID=8319 RepID=A0AAV7L2B6_PLEWA|nr:hypothetical protein NDU88_004756 [Pleurodeles waltl]KAJ1084611.1 hypothetical protein NDU88_004757 [Pleurodeles waltl]